MGTMNFGLHPMTDRYREFKYDWEKPYLEGTRGGMFRNTLGDIEYILTACAENGTRSEIECYDIGHLYTLAHFADRGLVKPPFFRSKCLWHPRRDRSAPRRHCAHETGGGTVVRGPISLVRSGQRKLSYQRPSFIWSHHV